MDKATNRRIVPMPPRCSIHPDYPTLGKACPICHERAIELHRGGNYKQAVERLFASVRQ